MSHFVAYILQFQEIIVYKIPPGGGGGSIASLRSKTNHFMEVGWLKRMKSMVMYQYLTYDKLFVHRKRWVDF